MPIHAHQEFPDHLQKHGSLSPPQPEASNREISGRDVRFALVCNLVANTYSHLPSTLQSLRLLVFKARRHVTALFSRPGMSLSSRQHYHNIDQMLMEKMGYASNERSASRTQTLRIGLAIAATVVFVLICILSPTGPTSSSLHGGASNDGSLLVFNETFGFGAILLLSLPDRTDRRDAMSLLTSLYNVTITHTIDAVRGEDISQKALPYGKARTEQDSGHMGSWRSHMDVFKYIVDNRIETALILEDDIDWDVEIHHELLLLSRALRTSHLRGPWSPSELARAPYGLDWDIMHLANALSESPPAPFDTLHTTYVDPSRNPRSDKADPKGPRWHNWKSILENTGTTAEDERVIIPDYASLGLAAIAVSYAGAQRMLYQLSWMGLDEGLDWSIRKMIEKGTIHGWTVAPPLMGTWTVGDSLDSDIRKEGLAPSLAPGTKGNKEGGASNIEFSAREAMGKMLEREEYWRRERFENVW